MINSQNAFAKNLKSHLIRIIDDIAADPASVAKNPGVDFTRKRSLDIKTLLLLMLGMGGNTLNKEIYDYFTKHHLDVPSASAFVQQRAKLKEDALLELFHNFNTHLENEKLYKGYRLLAVDGMDLQIATDPEEGSYMPNPGREPFNMLHVNALYDLLNKVYVDCIIEPRPSYNESRACITMAENRRYSGKAIIIGDRGYLGRNLQEHINRLPGVYYIFRVKSNGYKETMELPETTLDVYRTVELRTGQTNADKEAYASGKAIYAPGPSKFGKAKKDVAWEFESPFLFSVRIVRFHIGNKGEYETLVTNLPKDEFPLEAMKELYGMRWGIIPISA